jgi:acetylornithine deacetylase/succinyl-diaminopimelate desuccinylase-like protein
MSRNSIKSYIESNQDRFVAELQELVRQPSISAQNIGMEECAQLLTKILEKRGFQVRLLEAGGHPSVYGERKGSSGKVLLFYSHYDVQPPDPIEAWKSPPFAAEIREGKIYGRGVSDHKGTIMARMHAIDAIVSIGGKIPSTLKFILDGEEESGSPSLKAIVLQNRELLKADAAFYAGGGKDEKDRPTVRCGHKGMCYVELTSKAANQDLHSRWAAIVPNPAWRLIQGLRTLKNERDEILIPGFYEEVNPVTADDEAAMRTIPFEVDTIKKNFGLKSLLKDVSGMDALRNFLFSPTCNIAGFTSGYSGKGQKTLLPHTASAKIDMRLVPSQRPLDIFEKLKRYLKESGYGDIQVDLISTLEPARTPVSDPIVRQVVDSTRRVYGQDPVVSPIWAGSSPRYLFSKKEYLGIPMVTDTGVSNADSRHHSPNENIRIADYLQGIELMADILQRF